MAVTRTLPAKKLTGKTQTSHSEIVPTPPPADPQLLNDKAAAKFLCVSCHTLAIWRMKKIGPVYSRVNGTRIRYQKSHLIAFALEDTIYPSDAQVVA